MQSKEEKRKSALKRREADLKGYIHDRDHGSDSSNTLKYGFQTKLNGKISNAKFDIQNLKRKLNIS